MLFIIIENSCSQDEKEQQTNLVIILFIIIENSFSQDVKEQELDVAGVGRRQNVSLENFDQIQVERFHLGAVFAVNVLDKGLHSVVQVGLGNHVGRFPEGVWTDLVFSLLLVFFFFE